MNNATKHDIKIKLEKKMVALQSNMKNERSVYVTYIEHKLCVVFCLGKKRKAKTT